MSLADPLNSESRYRPPIVLGANAGPVADFEGLLGEGTDLWADDAEFAAFRVELRRWRKQDRDERRFN
jgi:hypothetical protein